MPEVESRTGANPVDQVLAEFDGRRGDFERLRDATKHLIENILHEDEISIQSVQARVKSREKLKIKYRDSEKDYKCLDDISDLVGIRIITYYSDNIDQIASIIDREFEQRGPSEDKRIGKADTFGYGAIHMDCAYSPARLSNTEYKRFTGARFEVQITTILGHAWAEMHHPWYDDRSSPIEEIRRFHRLAAVLELAEQEFLEIRRKKDDRIRIASVRVAAKAPEVPITQESLNAYIEENDDKIAMLDTEVATLLFGKASLQRTMSTGPIAQIVNGAGIATIQQLDDKLRVGRDALMEFVKQTIPIWSASRSFGSKSYGRGLSIVHFAYLMGGAAGEQRLRGVYQRAGMEFLPGFDVDRFVTVASEVATAFGLT